MQRSLGLLAVALGVVLSPQHASGAVTVSVSGNVAEAEISLAGGIGAQLTLEFESASGLSSSSLGISAQLVDVTAATLLARLPSGAGSIQTGFPVLIQIEPPALGGLSFVDTVAIELHTENLEFTQGTPLRLFAAPTGGAFSDITTSVGSGSYRARGDRGTFSEFLVVADLRSAADVVEVKLDALDAKIAQRASVISGSVVDDLEELAAATREAVANDDLEGALAELDDFLELVDAHSGDEIPNQWRALRDRTNAAGELLELGRTLRFSLALLADGS